MLVWQGGAPQQAGSRLLQNIWKRLARSMHDTAKVRVSMHAMHMKQLRPELEIEKGTPRDKQLSSDLMGLRAPEAKEEFGFAACIGRGHGPVHHSTMNHLTDSTGCGQQV